MLDTQHTPSHRMIPLNIVMTYPVHWGRYEVLRDFVQNFYDSVGYKKWNNALQYDYTDGALSIWVEGVRFSYEWRLHLGASTKTGIAGSKAGYFGEGFKIASLCAHRDLGWTVCMSSGDWELTVTDVRETIDGQAVKMLAYDVRKVEDSPRSKLVLSNLHNYDYSMFKSVLLSFYYPENPLLGKRIWEGSQGAVYTRGSAPYDERLPRTRDFGRKGIVFCGFQLLGSNPFNLVVCLHSWRKSDRERKALYTFDVVDVFEQIACIISPEGAMDMLEKMRRNWNTVPHRRIDIDSWHPAVCNLVDMIARSPTATARFREKYPNLLCLRPIHTMHDRNRRSQARSWLSSQETHYRLVQSVFLQLGYPTLEAKCESCGGFVVDDSPTPLESKCFVVLEGLVGTLYAGFFMQENAPARKVIRNQRAAYHGMATLHKARKAERNNRGLYVRYNVGEIYLKESIFVEDGFFDAVATYVHESCHAFGRDSSESFSNALTHAMEMLLSQPEVVEVFRKLWRNAFASAPASPHEVTAASD